MKDVGGFHGDFYRGFLRLGRWSKLLKFKELTDDLFQGVVQLGKDRHRVRW